MSQKTKLLITKMGQILKIEHTVCLGPNKVSLNLALFARRKVKSAVSNCSCDYIYHAISLYPNELANTKSTVNANSG